MEEKCCVVWPESREIICSLCKEKAGSLRIYACGLSALLRIWTHITSINLFPDNTTPSCKTCCLIRNRNLFRPLQSEDQIFVLTFPDNSCFPNHPKICNQENYLPGVESKRSKDICKNSRSKQGPKRSQSFALAETVFCYKSHSSFDSDMKTDGLVFQR